MHIIFMKLNIGYALDTGSAYVTCEAKLKSVYIFFFFLNLANPITRVMANEINYGHPSCKL